MGIENVGPKNVVGSQPAVPKAVVKAEPSPKIVLDNFSYSLPPAEPKLKLEMPEHDDFKERPFMGPKAFESQSFKPRLGISEDLGNNTVLDLDASPKHGGTIKVKLRKTF